MVDNAIVQYHPYEFFNPRILYVNGDLIAEIISNKEQLHRISLISPAKLYFDKPEWIFHQPSLDVVCVEGRVETHVHTKALSSLRQEFLGTFKFFF